MYGLRGYENLDTVEDYEKELKKVNKALDIEESEENIKELQNYKEYLIAQIYIKKVAFKND